MGWLTRTILGRSLLIMVLTVVILANVLVTWIDRTPYTELNFYGQMMSRLDSIENLVTIRSADSLTVGWAKVSLTPPKAVPLAGYGARDPKTMDGIHDSTYARVIVLSGSGQAIAIVSADLLIVHPVIRKALTRRLTDSASPISYVYFSATHTHSAPGGWAPGVVGELFAGDYDPAMVEWIAQQMYAGILTAYEDLSIGSIGYAELSIPDLIKNRLVGLEGTTDPLLKLLIFQKDTVSGIHGFYGAHATCLDHRFRSLSGDYPAFFNRTLATSPGIEYSGFSAGAVGSMGPADINLKQVKKARQIGERLAEQTKLLMLIGPPTESQIVFRAYDVKLPLRSPQLRVSRNLSIRPWVFRRLLGDDNVRISVLQINRHLLIGTPCDFSGELAVSLHRYAREKDLNLIITSFNGDYIGYVPEDRWYDYDTYETRTMSWFGFDNGAYFSEVIRRLIDIHAL